ncbi:uncharacterized protein LOC141886465 isoform X3 [Acropora palmata]|uniref:uncharacterized protein LOC141886465 isoform X3 n=1 Tax=Acropora palmata TaxID=6131 RepID=UPI003DA094DA
MELRVSGIQSHYAGKCVPTILELNWNQRGKVTQRLVNAWRDLRRRAQVNMRRPRANRNGITWAIFHSKGKVYFSIEQLTIEVIVGRMDAR